ncbi:translocation/assembly module TamB domain-containing protein [Pseudomonas tohonis]|uniref:translocation/assembly module TamB domain-containing protein n=1 Tax=Pseudomonas tohonis TaxID=2725477 RepID=UPI0021DA53AE|nr:translocation/assembly module TamB domain-containing protein [Pseudomonas tohonis]UXY50786.1 translocation/assembly module TamB [Pseudomonas tohonis]
MRRGLRLGLLAVAGALALSLAGVAALLFSEAGGRWLLARVPGLTVEGFSGTLGGRWSAEHLAWQQDGDSLSITAPVLEWSPGCLLQLTLCIDTLAAEAVALSLAPGGEPSDEPLQLPALDLPLAIRLGEVRVQRFELDGSEQLSGLHLRAQWLADGVHIEEAGLRLGDLALALEGTLQPRDGWPLEASGSLQLPAVDGQPWSLALEAKGDLQGTLVAHATSSGYLAATLDGQLQALAPHLPASARIRAAGFKAQAELPDTLTLQRIELDAKGDLQQGYAVQGRANLPGQGGDVALDLAGKVTAAGAEVQRLLLSAAAEQSVQLQGRIDWQQALAIDAQLAWRDFPWPRLYPQEQEPPVALQRLDGGVHFSEGRYQGQIDAALKGPAGDFSLASPLQGDLARVELPDLQLKAGQGKARGRLQLGFADGLDWDTALALDDLDPAYWQAELPGRLAGTLASQGRYRQQLELKADLDLKGQLRGQPALLKAVAEGAGQRWELGQLRARLGDNRIDGKGRLDQRLDGQLDIALGRLGQLWPGLFGGLTGKLVVAGSADAPQGQLDLKGERLGLRDQRLRQLTLQARLDARQNGTLQLDASQLQAGDKALGDLSLKASGDRQRQQLETRLQGPLLDLQLALDGLLDQGDWRGRLSRGELQSGGQDWRLEQPAKLQRLADGRLELGAHCWRSGPASLCGGDQRLLPEPKLDYRLRDFPLDSLAEWLPDDFAWHGTLDGDLQLELPARGPSGRVQLDASNGVLRLREEGRDGKWVDFPYQAMRLESTLRPQGIDSRLLFQGERLGRLQVDARIDPRPLRKPLSGDFRLEGLDLAVLRPFVTGVEELEGQLDGAGTLGGTLLAPNVLGQVRLHGGKLAGGDLPTRIEDLTLDARIAGESLELSGAWRSGEKGRGTLSGTLAWSQGLDMDLAVRGNALPVVVEPYANLDVDPDLRVRMADQRLALTGKVLVPRGQIKIRELPPQAVKVSPDAHLVGEQEDEQAPLQLAMDVDVEVGQERLSFSGFGLTADLVGHLKVGDNLAGRGELSLKNGRYRAYGQRLDLRRARLLFAGPLDQPYLDVEAVRKIGDVTAGIRLNGRADEPTTQVFSTPAMSQEQALSYLVLGRPLERGSDGNALGQAALALGLSGSAPLTSELAQKLGLKDFQIGDDGATGVLTDRLSIRYGLGVLEPTSVVALRYELTKRLYIEAASGLASSLDLFYKRDF